jgi:hypothetical protein
LGLEAAESSSWLEKREGARIRRKDKDKNISAALQTHMDQYKWYHKGS